MNKIKNNLWRHVLQLGVIVIIAGFILKVFFGGSPADVEAYCPFGGLQALLTYLNSNTLACSMSIVQIAMGITLAVGVVLFSKLFCGYLCPLGTVSEWLGSFGKKIKIHIRPNSVADNILRSIKYVLLFWIFHTTISSSELFCKNFDPYYAVATGFRGEITLWMTIISLVLLFLGNLCIDMFWCKYICPLGALSNIFKFTLTFIGLLIISLILGHYGLPMQWYWLLGIACLIGYIFEIIYHESKVFPLLRITRNEEKCNHCGLCSQKCPQKIDIENTEVVKDIDCTLCGECMGSCNRKALTINRKPRLRWLPAILTIILFFTGIQMGRYWEIPTIDEYWGDVEKSQQLESFEREGMRSVKCFGSSKAFAARMKQVPGVYGVTTYVNRFAVIIHYNPTETTKEKVENAMFTPVKRKLHTPPAEITNLKVLTIGVEKLFDQMDITFLGNIFRTKEGFYGIQSEYGCPVKIKLFMDLDKPVDKKELKSIVETKVFEMPVHGGGVKEIKCNYELVNIDDKIDTISRRDFLELMFPIFQTQFKNAEKKYHNIETAVYEIPYPGLDKPIIQRQLPYLGSFLSTKEGITGITTALNEDTPVIRITYIPEILNDDNIWEILQTPVWLIHYSNGTTKEINAALNFKTKGKTIK